MIWIASPRLAVGVSVVGWNENSRLQRASTQAATSVPAADGESELERRVLVLVRQTLGLRAFLLCDSPTTRSAVTDARCSMFSAVTLLPASGAIAQPRAEQVDPFAVAAAGLGRVIWSRVATLDRIGVDPFVLSAPQAADCPDRTGCCPPVYRSDFVLGGLVVADVRGAVGSGRWRAHVDYLRSTREGVTLQSTCWRRGGSWSGTTPARRCRSAPACAAASVIRPGRRWTGRSAAGSSCAWTSGSSCFRVGIGAGIGF